MNLSEQKSTLPSKLAGERLELGVADLRRSIELKEKDGADTTAEKIGLIEKINNIQYSSEEKTSFDNWKKETPLNSKDQPIQIDDSKEILGFLPEVPNYTEGPVNLFFSLPTGFSDDDLDGIFKLFSQKNPNFEISIVQYTDDVISVGMGDKIRNKSTNLDGQYYGHYHPTGNFVLENPEKLPNSFMLGLLPSSGDVRGFLKNPDVVKNGTRIYSKNGYVLITPSVKFDNPDEAVEEYKRIYLDLFLGVNKFGFSSNEDVAKYFQEHFKMDLQFFLNKMGKNIPR